ncbi:holo-ACP synthase [Clostridium uliginosum]|uniref:Holo-[acyl-carrier-protein] synthase n=1 Tax=Clostridium uliginosum TaxID=119641 RepID=A0A1I1QGY8_9CLOT|nr:holo-ACP synthase [Clostridium uliginosum]SFD21262.1 holo-[acyl-carrier protein] synthase [Clostridium uliginosum]
MIIGIGTDIIEIDRIKNIIEKTPNFLQRFFTVKEIEYFKLKGLKANTVAGNFAGKEAVSKALGTGFRGFGLKDIEILRDDLGKPIVNLSHKISEVLKIKELNIFISISHSNKDAIAYVVLEEN